MDRIEDTLLTPGDLDALLRPDMHDLAAIRVLRGEDRALVASAQPVRSIRNALENQSDPAHLETRP